MIKLTSAATDKAHCHRKLHGTNSAVLITITNNATSACSSSSIAIANRVWLRITVRHSAIVATRQWRSNLPKKDALKTIIATRISNAQKYDVVAKYVDTNVLTSSKFAASSRIKITNPILSRELIHSRAGSLGSVNASSEPCA